MLACCLLSLSFDKKCLLMMQAMDSEVWYDIISTMMLSTVVQCYWRSHLCVVDDLNHYFVLQLWDEGSGRMTA